MVLETGSSPSQPLAASFDKAAVAANLNLNRDLTNSVLQTKESAQKFSTLQPIENTRDLNTNSSKMLQLPEIASKQKFKFGFPTGGVNSLLEIKSETAGSTAARRPLNFRNQSVSKIEEDAHIDS